MYFQTGRLGLKRVVKAVDNIDIRVSRGEVLGLVGESGSGKSTLGRVLLRIYRPTSGRIIFDGMDITEVPEPRLRSLRRRMQLIPQDPYASFNPLRSIGDALIEPLVEHGIFTPGEARREVVSMLERMGIVPAEEYLGRKPYQFSGGQLQRVAIARAMLLKPDFIVADEPTSSLDVSIRSSILRLLKEYKDQLNQGLVFITHDLALARLISDNIAIMYLGKIVEYGSVEEVLSEPAHPYTAALITAIPKLEEYRVEKPVILKGEIPDPSSIPTGCRLRPRCPLARSECSELGENLIKISENHYTACPYFIEKRS